MASPSLAIHIQSTKAPWVSLLIIKEGQRAEKLVPAPDGFRIELVKGTKCRTAAGLFEEFARALHFPDYFGHNWDALEECLADLEWLPAKGYVLLLNDADQLLRDDEEGYATFLEVLSDAGEAWASGQAGTGRATPFHALLAVTSHKKNQRPHWAVPVISCDSAPTPLRVSGRSRRGSSRR